MPEFDDPNIDKEAAIVGVLGKEIVCVVFSFFPYPFTEDDSPYPEVRSAVANTDDTSIPASTFRTWVLGLFWAIIIPVSGRKEDSIGPYILNPFLEQGLNQFFFFRYPSVQVSGVSIVDKIASFNMCANE